MPLTDTEIKRALDSGAWKAFRDGEGEMKLFLHSAGMIAIGLFCVIMEVFFAAVAVALPWIGYQVCARRR